MNEDRARELIADKRAELQSLLADTERAGNDDRTSTPEARDSVDPSPGFQTQAVDDAIADGIRDRLAALDRAEQRLEAGTYGTSVQSGEPIPDERLEADPAAELTVAEAAAIE